MIAALPVLATYVAGQRAWADGETAGRPAGARGPGPSPGERQVSPGQTHRGRPAGEHVAAVGLIASTAMLALPPDLPAAG